jgi:anti-sigma regulatory factor (Ser/Thr protein kinase)
MRRIDGGGADRPPSDLATVAAHQVLAVRVAATPDNVPQLRRMLTSFAAVHGASDEVRKDIALAVSEAVTNAVVHGSGRDPSRSIDVLADVEGGAVEIVVADEGPGLDAAVDSDGLGLGLGLMALSSARFTVRDRQPHGTEVWLRFVL